MENSKKYKIEIEEIYDKELKDINEIFTTFLYQLWEDDEYLGSIKIHGVNKLKGLPTALNCLLDKLSGKEDDE